MKILSPPIQLGVALIFLASFTACHDSKDKPPSKPEDRIELIKKGPGKYIQAHSLIRTLDGHEGPEYSTGDVIRESQKARARVKSFQKEEYDWIERGPGNVGGRTRGLIVDPADSTARTWFLGSVGGGIWYTDDAGESWELLTKEFSNLATSALAMAPSRQDVIYAGTGEGFGNIDGIAGSGIWKSTDRGRTWELLPATRENAFRNVTRIVVLPDNEDEVIASTRTTIANNITRTYIQKSSDGGQTWESKYERSTSIVQQLVVAPHDNNVIYGTLNNEGVLRSTDRGETWEQIWAADNDVRRIEMAIAPNDDGVIYLSCELEEGSRLYFTRDTFNTVTEPIFNGRQPDWLVGQGWYDNTIAVHPYNDSIVWVAGQGPMLELKMGDTIGIIKKYDNFRNLSFFITSIEDSPFNDESAGTAFSLFEGLPVSLGTTNDDIIDIEIRIGEESRSMAHLIDVNINTFEFAYNSMIEVPFEAWDAKNNRQIALSVYDVNGDGEWTFENYSGQSSPFHDVIVTNNLDYTETAHPTIENNNPLFKAQYYVFMGRAASYTGPRDTLPFGIMFFNTKQEEGLISSFLPITDGYFAYSDISPVGTKGVHVDHHNIIMIPRDSATGAFYVLNANDGGIAFSIDNGETFSQTGDSYNADGSFISLDGYNTSQFYGIDKKNGESRYVGGTQDNGSWVSPAEPDSTSKWVEAPSGDGFEAAWHYEDTRLILETSQFNNLYKSYDEGLNWRRIQLPESEGPFISRLASSQLNPDLVFMVSDTGVLRSADFAETWEIIDMPEVWGFNGSWGSPITISLADADYVWTGTRVNQNSRVCVSTDGGLSFKGTSAYTQAETGTITGLATHPFDPNIAYVLSSQKGAPKILMTDNLGTSWRDLSGYGPNSLSEGFPDVAVYSLLVMPWDDLMMWAGTEIGIFESLDGGMTWAYADNGLPAVSVWQMKIVNDEIVVATHGRGVYTLNTEQFNVSSTFDTEEFAYDKLDVYPNPVSSISTVRYTVDKSQHVELTLWSLGGQKLRTLVRDMHLPGEYKIMLDGMNLDSGMYLLHWTGDHGQALRKIVVNN